MCDRRSSVRTGWLRRGPIDSIARSPAGSRLAGSVVRRRVIPCLAPSARSALLKSKKNQESSRRKQGHRRPSNLACPRLSEHTLSSSAAGKAREASEKNDRTNPRRAVV